MFEKSNFLIRPSQHLINGESKCLKRLNNQTLYGQMFEGAKWLSIGRRIEDFVIKVHNP